MDWPTARAPRRASTRLGWMCCPKRRGVVRDLGTLRPLILKNTDTKIVAATQARGMRLVIAKGACATQRGFISRRDFTQNVVQLATYASALRSAAPPRDWLAAPLCNIVAALLSVRRRRARMVLRLQDMPEAALRVVDPIRASMVLLLRIGGVHEIGQEISGVASNPQFAAPKRRSSRMRPPARER